MSNPFVRPLSRILETTWSPTIRRLRYTRWTSDGAYTYSSVNNFETLYMSDVGKSLSLVGLKTTSYLLAKTFLQCQSILDQAFISLFKCSWTRCFFLFKQIQRIISFQTPCEGPESTGQERCAGCTLALNWITTIVLQHNNFFSSGTETSK